MCLAIPGKIVAIDSTDSLMRNGIADFGGVRKEINLVYVPEAKIGDYVIVHVGFAISKIDEDSAKKTFSYLREMYNP